MGITIKDIAEYCNVSVGTVDRALNDRSGISQKTKKKILEAVEKLDYRPNYVGRSLARGKTMTIGIVCFDLYNNFFPELIDAIESMAKKKGYFIHLILTHREFELEADGLRYLQERQVDGIILFPIGIQKDYIASIKNMNIPVVTIYNRLDEDLPFVGVNDLQAMEDAVQYIAQKGYKKITYFTPDISLQEEKNLNTFTLRQRLQGYMNGIERMQLGSPEVLEHGSIEEKVDVYLKTHNLEEKSAILCLCDSYAIKVLKCLQIRGIQVPEQVGLMGYDDLEQLNYIKPRLATIKYSVSKMGSAVVDKLFQCMDNSELGKECLLDYSIVEGESLI